MAHRREHPRTLTARTRPARAVLAITALAIAATLLPATPAAAHDTYDGAYRKWPWRAGRERTLTVLPGQCPHCPGIQSSSAWKAIDANLDYETVTSIGPGTVDIYEPAGGRAGKFIRIRDADGTYLTYEHLSRSLVSAGATVVAGQPIAVSGCTGNCTGPHLHFQRTDGPSFTSNALPLVRISGHGGSGDPLTLSPYDSDNGGIGYSSAGIASVKIQDEYRNLGGATWGVTSKVGPAWSPCRSRGQTGTWFRYTCDPPGTGGSVQTYLGPGDAPRALFVRTGAARGWSMRDSAFAAYTEVFGGHDWITWLGYPTSNRFGIAGGARQTFEFGHIDLNGGACWQRMYVRGVLWHTYYFCD